MLSGAISGLLRRSPSSRVVMVLLLSVGSAGLVRSPAAAEQIATTSESFHSEESSARLPKIWEALLVVPRDVEQNGHLRFRFWRIANRRPTKGSVVLEVEIHRDTNGNGATDSVETLSASGKVAAHSYAATLGPIDALRAGDQIFVTARLKAMPKLSSQGRAVLEVALLDAPSICPETNGLGGEITPPVKVLFPSPQYTLEARLARVQGTVILQSIIDCDGRVSRFQVLKSLPMGLDQASVEAVSRWRFAPARVDGVPVPVFYNLTINFLLQASGATAAGQLAPSVTVAGAIADRPF